MIDAQNGTFQLQARTSLAQGNSTTATVFIAGAAKEKDTSVVEVRVKKAGEIDIKIGTSKSALTFPFFVFFYTLYRIYTLNLHQRLLLTNFNLKLNANYRSNNERLTSC